MRTWRRIVSKMTKVQQTLDRSIRTFGVTSFLFKLSTLASQMPTVFVRKENFLWLS